MLLIKTDFSTRWLQHDWRRVLLNLENMDTSEFVEFAKATIDYVADYNDSVRSRNVLPDVEPGYLSKLLPKEAPQKSEKWQEVLEDVEKYIMPGVNF